MNKNKLTALFMTLSMMFIMVSVETVTGMVEKEHYRFICVNLKEDIYKNLKSGFKQDLLYFVDFMKYIKKLEKQKRMTTFVTRLIIMLL